MRAIPFLSVALALVPVALTAQGGVGFAIGTRTYRSGPILPSTNPGTFHPMHVTEYSANLHVVTIRRVRIGLRVGGFQGDFGIEGRRSFVAQSDAVHGYGAQATGTVPVITLTPGGTLAFAAEAGVESVAFAGEEQFRGVFSVGPTLRLPLSERWDLQLGAMASTLSSTPYRDEILEDGVTNGNHWWTTLRIGVVRRFGPQ